MNKTRQFFEYKYKGETRKFLLMSDEVKHIKKQIDLFGIYKTFVQFTGKIDCNNIKLVIETIENKKD